MIKKLLWSHAYRFSQAAERSWVNIS